MRNQTKITLAVIVTFFLLFQGCSCFKPDPEEVKKLECEAIRVAFLKNMKHESFYTKVNGLCLPVLKPDKTTSQDFFSDSSCLVPFAYYPQDYLTYCYNNLLNDERTREYIGNPKLWTHLDSTSAFKETKWTLSQGARLNLMVLDQTKETRPFLKKVNFRQAENCPLEMDILKNKSDGKDLKPILFFFGGGWKAWGPGAPLSIEITAANLTAKGYIVFAAYYRLLEHDDAPPECNGADGAKMLSDVIAAKDWVYQYGQNYGMSSQYGKATGKKKLSVYGQSAGGHLAGYLATNYPQEVDKAVLMYPATDFAFFIDQTKPGGMYVDSYDGVKPLVVDFVNEPGVTNVSDIDTSLEIVQKDSYPTIINPNPGNFPGYFMVQGSADEIAPIQMTTRMCQALNPNESPTDAPYKTCDTVQNCSTFSSCGNSNQLRIIGLAGHSLELRCFNQDLGKIVNKLYHMDVVCAPGSYQGAELVKGALIEIYDGFLD